jgi:hypothetical protein
MMPLSLYRLAQESRCPSFPLIRPRAEAFALHALFPCGCIRDGDAHGLASSTAVPAVEFQVLTATISDEGVAGLYQASLWAVLRDSLGSTRGRPDVLWRVTTIEATVPAMVSTAVDAVRRSAAAFNLGVRIALLLL